MPPNKAMVVAEWMRRASTDLAAATLLMSHKEPLLEPAVFHCQQAAEKALKALLVQHEKAFPKTHSIAELRVLVVGVDKSLAELCDRAAVLSPYAYIFRYPGAEDQPSVHDADFALRLANEVVATVARRLHQPGTSDK